MMFTNRNIHRDIAYFYLGLILAFSFSGIILNHRQDWYPMDYSYETKEVELEIPADIAQLDSQEYIKKISTQWDLADAYDSHRIRENELRVHYKDNVILDADITTGKGLIEYKRKVPFLGHTMFLHKTTNSFWIWYSDIFGVAMLVIAITGMLITKARTVLEKEDGNWLWPDSYSPYFS
jgi:hypothetical protein